MQGRGNVCGSRSSDSFCHSEVHFSPDGLTPIRVEEERERERTGSLETHALFEI